MRPDRPARQEPEQKTGDDGEPKVGQEWETEDDAKRGSIDAAMTPSQRSAPGSGFLHRPVAVVTVISGIVASLTAVIGLAINIFGGSGQSGDDLGGEDARSANGFEETTPERGEGTTAESMIEQCVLDHGLSSERQRDEHVAGGVLFRQCSWPPAHGADADGYAEINITSHPGPGTSEAEGMTVADYVQSTCRNVELIYIFGNQGHSTAEEPILLTKGEVRRVEGGSVWRPRNQAEAAAYAPGRDESIVMSNGRYSVESARCV